VVRRSAHGLSAPVRNDPVALPSYRFFKKVLTRGKGWLMETAILLAVAASLCTATSSVCQRMGAKSSQPAGFDAGLMFRLARQPVWLLGIAAMIGGFVLQLTALRFGALALVQPILAAELVFVFGYLALAGSGRVTRRDWLAATAMSVGIGVFLRVASPSGGRLHAPGSSWLVAGLATAGVVVLAITVAFGLGRRRGASGTRRAAVLGAGRVPARIHHLGPAVGQPAREVPVRRAHPHRGRRPGR
jgi:drug/metabolite transporter (DMT)-like permease